MMAQSPGFRRTFWSVAERIDRLPYFVAIRRGLALPLPLLLIGALALIARFPSAAAPHGVLAQALGSARLDSCLDDLVASTFGIGSLVALYGFTDALAGIYNRRLGQRIVNPQVAVVVVTGCFFMLMAPAHEHSLQASLSLGHGLFGALIVASLGGSLFSRLCRVRALRTPFSNLSNDPIVGDVLAATPAAVLTILTFVLLKAGWVNWYGPELLEAAVARLSERLPYFSNNLAFGLGYETASQLLWLLGIHGPNALYVVQQNVLVPAESANALALASGGHPQFVFTYAFFSAFARMGGSGGTLSLVFALLLVSRTVRGRKLAVFTMLPALFNINEPLLFGLPIVLNPIYVIPFILAPLVQILIAYLAIVMHIMPYTAYSIAWPTPAVYSGYAATGSFAGALVQLFCLAAGTLIYVPFVRIAEQIAEKRGQKLLGSLLSVAESPESSLQAKRCLDLPGDEGRLAVSLASDLADAIRTQKQIFLEFQPQVDVRTGCAFGVEALLRWQHPSLGRVAPPIAVAIADDVGQTDRLGLHILSLACRQRSIWADVLPADFVIAVNLSPRQLKDPHFYRNVLDILQREHLHPSLLELEITESMMLVPDVNTIDNLRRLREVGVKVALDDFGMGHTSLHYLRELPLDTVKLDRSLADVTPGSVNEHIVKSIADLSRTLNLSLVVEGVESEGQLSCLAAIGCKRFQGYFFSRPLAAPACLDFLLQANRARRFAA